MNLFGFDISLTRSSDASARQSRAAEAAEFRQKAAAENASARQKRSGELSKSRQNKVTHARYIGGLLAQARLSKGVPDFPTRIDSFICAEWMRIVSRAQFIAERSDHARKFVAMLRENVIGKNGISLLPQITIGATAKPDMPTCDAIADAWGAWSKKGVCEVTGAMSRADVEKLAISHIAHTGEFIVQLCYGPEVGPWGFAIRFIDPTRLDPNHVQQLDNGRFIKHGIECNVLGRPVAYWFRGGNEKDIYATSATNQRYERVPAEQIIHGFISEYAGQKRGLPIMRTAVEQMRVLHDFVDCTLVNARISASKVGFLRKAKESDDPTVVEADELPDGVSAEPGSFPFIGDNDFVSPDWQFPDAAIEPFMRGLLRSMASGLNVSYNNLASDLTAVNFSSLRQGALDDRETWMGLQEWFASTFEEPVYLAWLEYSLLAGKIKIAGQALRPSSLERCKAVKFRGRRWAWIDPAAEISAAEKAIKLKVKSRSQIMRDNGDNPWDVFNEIVTENSDMESLGLDTAVHVAGDTNPGKPEAPDATGGKEE